MITEQTQKRYAAFRELVEKSDPEGRWLVLTHDNPDPDALASAALLGHILRRAFHRKVTTAYGGIIGRAENREMFKSLRLDFSHVRNLSFKSYRCFALVDAQPGTGNSQLPDEVIPDLVFDHHPLRKATYSARFFDLRREYGATATILAEYLLASGAPVTHALATGLVYAIRSETRDFGREFSGPDKAIYDDFFPRVNKRLLSRIQNANLPLSYFKNLHQALENLQSVGPLVVSHLGEVEQPDIVPEVADLLLRMEGKTWSLATGLFQGRVYLSIRTSNPRADAGRLMRRLVGRRGKGGGHGMIAGGWVKVEKALGGDPRTLQEQLATRLAQYLNKNPAKLTPVTFGNGAGAKSPALPPG